MFRCRFGRVEVYQPIPGPKDKTPSGPHTHVLPRLLALRRTHAATLPIPTGWVPCMTLFPPNPISNGHGGLRPFEKVQHEAFQSLWKRYGIQELVALKEEIFAAVSSQSTFPMSYRRHSTVRGALWCEWRSANGSRFAVRRCKRPRKGRAFRGRRRLPRSYPVKPAWRRSVRGANTLAKARHAAR